MIVLVRIHHPLSSIMLKKVHKDISSTELSCYWLFSTLSLIKTLNRIFLNVGVIHVYYKLYVIYHV